MYALIAVAVLLALTNAATGWKAYHIGQDNVRVEWDRANVEAAAAVESDRKSQEEKSRKSASILQAKIATQNIVNRQITDALDRELRKKPNNPDCDISDGVRGYVNDALRGGTSETGSGVPSASGTAPAAPVKPDR